MKSRIHDRNTIDDRQWYLLLQNPSPDAGREINNQVSIFDHCDLVRTGDSSSLVKDANSLTLFVHPVIVRSRSRRCPAPSLFALFLISFIKCQDAAREASLDISQESYISLRL
jgi:hypothetical protein